MRIRKGGRWNGLGVSITATVLFIHGVFNTCMLPGLYGGMELAFSLEGGLPSMCVCVDKVFAEVPPSSDWLYVNVLRRPRHLSRFSVRTRTSCFRAGRPSSYLSQTWHASGGSRSKRFSYRLSSRARLPTGRGPIPIPDRASLSPSTAPRPQPPPSLLKIRPSWIHSPKPFIPSRPPQTM